MISISKNNSCYKVAVIFVTVYFLWFSQTFADETSQTLSVSPTLVQITVEPSQDWQSELRIINVNNYDLEVFPQVVNFAPSGETGQGEMLPLIESESSGKTLAEWIAISTSSIVIPPQQTLSLPFSIKIPKDADPGGHYAAILIGTKPQSSDKSSSKVTTAQYVTALIFTKVAGEVNESGSIREFNVIQWLNTKPDITFGLRFENTGNVHLQPQGDIRIYNMWGTERGVIPINYQTHFGNVLPKSIRKFDFTWSGENNLLDIGRYKAIVTLGYGDEKKMFVTSTVYFWIVPLKQIVIFLVSCFLLLWFMSFVIKLYIRRMLSLAGLNTAQHYKNLSIRSERIDLKNTVVIKNYKTVTAPVSTGINELITKVKTAHSFKDFIKNIYNLAKSYKFLILSLLIVIVIVILSIFYFKDVKSVNRLYNVTIDNHGTNQALSAEQIFYDKLDKLPKVEGVDLVKNPKLSIDIINSSGVLGLGATLRQFLESYNYKIENLENALNRTEEKTVIIYNPDNQKEALQISKLLDGALTSADVATPVNKIKIYTGYDRKDK